MASVEHMLNFLLEREDTLSEWEKDFVNSVSNLPENWPLSPFQLEKLREIYDAH